MASKALPTARTFRSKDTKRNAAYFPLVDVEGDDTVPPAVKAHRGPVYIVTRTVRTRRGFGTIIHTLTTFVNTKQKAHKMAVVWTSVQTRDR